jgi:chromosome partitioning protein
MKMLSVNVIAIINQKDCVVKTTIAINLCAQFAREGKRILAINLDPQANLTVMLNGGQFEFNTTIFRVFEYAKST